GVRARLQAMVRRVARAPEPTTLKVDDLVLDLLSRRVTRGDVVIDLRPREFALLEYLLRNVGKVVSKTMILSHVWAYSFDPQTNIVHVRVSRLREKIDRRFHKNRLRTVRGGGYAIRAWARDAPAGLRTAARRLVRDAVRRRLAGDHVSHVPADVRLAGAARSANHREPAR